MALALVLLFFGGFLAFAWWTSPRIDYPLPAHLRHGGGSASSAGASGDAGGLRQR
jgi:hypothetical protein